MSETNLTEHRLSESPDEDIVEYRALSSLAVAGLVFGLLSIFALVDRFGWVLPAVGLLLSGWALLRIARNEPALIGRKAALAGLVLSLLFGSAAVSQYFVYRRMLDRQARQFAAAWFELLATGQPHKAHQLTIGPAERRPLDATLWDFYRNGPTLREELDQYANGQLQRALLELGPRAQVRFWKTTALGGKQGQEEVGQLFTVTFEDPGTFEDSGEKKTFLVSLWMRRFPAKYPDRVNWVIRHAEGGVRPPSMPEQ